LLLDYAFSVLGLHNVMLDVAGYNERAIRAYRRAGFREIGRRRQSYRLGDRVYDQVFMDCLATEFESPLKPVLDRP
jgi:RimJ/RimL family protein N-acetyltransferase